MRVQHTRLCSNEAPYIMRMSLVVQPKIRSVAKIQSKRSFVWRRDSGTRFIRADIELNYKCIRLDLFNSHGRSGPGYRDNSPRVDLKCAVPGSVLTRFFAFLRVCCACCRPFPFADFVASCRLVDGSFLPDPMRIFSCARISPDPFRLARL